MLHIGLHFAVPVLVAWVFYRPRWTSAGLILLATMVVDLDHLAANPVYDPERCSIGFHPLHTAPAVVLYALLLLAPVLTRLADEVPRQWANPLRSIHLIGLGLLIHMALDALDCAL